MAKYQEHECLSNKEVKIAVLEGDINRCFKCRCVVI